MRQRVMIVGGSVVHFARRGLRGLGVGWFGVSRRRRAGLRGGARCEEKQYESCAKNSIHARPDDAGVDFERTVRIRAESTAPAIAIGCKTAVAGCPNSNPFCVRWGKTLRGMRCVVEPEVQGLRGSSRSIVKFGKGLGALKCLAHSIFRHSASLSGLPTPRPGCR